MVPKEKILVVVGTDCDDPAQEHEFNRWYNEVHLPEVCKLPGVLNGKRYEVLEPEAGAPHSLVLYEIDGGSGLRNFNEYLKRQSEGKEPPFTPGPPYHLVWYKAFRYVAP